jgi:RNA polymerase-binding transcription factor DksA
VAQGPPIPEALQRLRTEALERCADRERELAALLAETTTIGGGTDDDEHDPDGSPVSLQRTLARALVERAAEDLEAAEGACRRLVEGTYGVCERCGLAIPPARLDALPAARTCVECERESGRRRLRTP